MFSRRGQDYRSSLITWTLYCCHSDPILYCSQLPNPLTVSSETQGVLSSISSSVLFYIFLVPTEISQSHFSSTLAVLLQLQPFNWCLFFLTGLHINGPWSGQTDVLILHCHFWITLLLSLKFQLWILGHQTIKAISSSLSQSLINLEGKPLNTLRGVILSNVAWLIHKMNDSPACWSLGSLLSFWTVLLCSFYFLPNPWCYLRTCHCQLSRPTLVFSAVSTLNCLTGRDSMCFHLLQKDKNTSTEKKT